MSVASENQPLFAGSIPEIYDKYLVPLIFEPFAIELAQRLAAQPLTNVLEIAAGTGVVTRRLAMTLPAKVFIVATDISQAMLDLAGSVGTIRAVEWRQADAFDLPFEINMDIAQHPSRLCNQAWAAEAKARVTARARAIRDTP